MVVTMKARFAALGVLMLAASAVPAAASTTFAVYNPVPSADGPVNNVQLLGSSSSGTLESFGSGSPVIFDYVAGAPLIALGDLQASSILNATESPYPVPGAPLANFDGSLSLIYDGPTKTVGTITLTKGVTNLLTDTFTGALFTAAGSAGTLADSNFSGTAVFSSDLVTFDPSLDENFTIGITSSTPPISFYPSGYLKSFKGVSQGNFAATITGTAGGGGVPEPTPWALMIIGFAGVGVAMRGNSRRTTANF